MSGHATVQATVAVALAGTVAMVSSFDVTELGLAMLSNLPTDSNAALCPLSIATVVAMLYCGARNSTREELERVLRLSDEAVNAFGATLRRTLEDGSNEGSRLRSATALYVGGNKQGVVSEQYKKDVAIARFGASVETVDFARHSESARLEINAWAAAETGGLVRDLLPLGAVDSTTVAVAANAVHFKGLWALTFEAKNTHEASFHVGSHRIVNVHMMRQLSRFPYTLLEEAGLQVLSLPYSGDGQMSMLLLLPIGGASLSSVLKHVRSGYGLAAVVRRMRIARVDVQVPRFALSASVDVKQALVDLGVSSLFDSTADLSGICPGGDVGVSSFFHRAVVEVTEEGTEAAAATAAVISKRSVPAPPELFVCNRPFAFVVWSMSTESAIFVGQVLDPTADGAKLRLAAKDEL